MSIKLDFQTIQKWLLQPYPSGTEAHGKWRTALFGFFFVTFFLYLFKPFGGYTFEGTRWQWLLECLGFGGVTLLVSILWALFTQIFSNFFDEARWNVWKELVTTMIFVTLIGSGNLLYAAYRYEQALSIGYFLQWQFVTWSVGIFPVAFGVFFKQLRFMNRYRQEAQQITQQVVGHVHQTSKQERIRLSGENQGELLDMAVQDLLYVLAADNYVVVYYLESQVLKNRMLRSSLKKVAEQLEAFPQCFRCHRTHLVNLDQVTAVLGNAQGYKLQLAFGDQLIPVSRSLNDTIRTRLNAL